MIQLTGNTHYTTAHEGKIMAIPFKSPKPPHDFIVSTEKTAITRHFKKRKVPSSTPGRLLLASWNIANLGAQKRDDDALKRFCQLERDSPQNA